LVQLKYERKDEEKAYLGRHASMIIRSSLLLWKWGRSCGIYGAGVSSVTAICGMCLSHVGIGKTWCSIQGTGEAVGEQYGFIIKDVTETLRGVFR